MTEMNKDNLAQFNYAHTGESVKSDEMGMREMQQRAYGLRNEQYILLKVPPASGKSRALMFIALDKLLNQGLKKAIIAVPERMIGKSFKRTNLTENGFFADWCPDLDLTVGYEPEGKVKSLLAFLDDPSQKIVVCTHSTLRFAFEQMGDVTRLNDTMLAIDEFHHVSADVVSSQLGNLVHTVMSGSTAHIVAMTGSYFRGDGAPVLLPEDEIRFKSMVYSFYDQLSGYTYLESLGINFCFYQGRYTDAIGEALDTDKKTLIHIPNVNSRESTGDKYEEVNAILTSIGEYIGKDPETGVITVRRREDGKLIKIADLVEDEPSERELIDNYLREAKGPDAIDIIIALAKAREGFDWPYCEHTLTVGYRGSLTEVVQIIGRCTRDCPGKVHTQFTNLVAQPDADFQDVKDSTNDHLKAIACSLLMEQVLAPDYHFRASMPEASDTRRANQIVISGFKEPSTPRTKEITTSDILDLKASFLQKQSTLQAMLDPDREHAAELINKVLWPQHIRETYPDLNDEEVEEVREYCVIDSFLRTSPLQGEIDHETGEDRRFLTFAGRCIKVQELDINLIDLENPFQRAYQFISRKLNPETLQLIRDTFTSPQIPMDKDLAIHLIKEIENFVETNDREPQSNARDPYEQQLAKALDTLRNMVSRGELEIND